MTFSKSMQKRIESQTSKQFKQRMAEVLRAELDQPERWHYVSFADREFLGAVVIKAHGTTDAVRLCHMLNINPGGQVLCVPWAAGEPLPPEHMRYRLLTKAEVKLLWPDAKSLGEHEADDIHPTQH